MAISVFDIFRVGIGPSSSHTVGPMRAAALFIRMLSHREMLPRVARITVDLMGSLGATGKGHSTDTAFVLGLMGLEPETLDVDAEPAILADIRDNRRLKLGGESEIGFEWDRDITFSPEKIARFHTNAIDVAALDAEGHTLLARRFYSVGGGFVVAGSEENPDIPEVPAAFNQVVLPYRYKHMVELIAFCGRDGKTIPEIVRENERVWRTDEEIDRELDHIWSVMKEAMDRGLRTEGMLPGAYKVARRAAGMKRRLEKISLTDDPLAVLDWVCSFAFAVGEENATGGRIVTAPTNGAAGVIPAVIEFYRQFVSGADQKGIRDFLLTAGAIGILFKTNASISGAEVGCQGEVGVACSMAAGGLAAVMGGNAYQIENAAEIGIWGSHATRWRVRSRFRVLNATRWRLRRRLPRPGFPWRATAVTIFRSMRRFRRCSKRAVICAINIRKPVREALRSASLSADRGKLPPEKSPDAIQKSIRRFLFIGFQSDQTAIGALMAGHGL